MNEAFRQPFDHADPADQLAERARKLLIASFTEAVCDARTMEIRTADDGAAVASGMLSGLACCLMASAEMTDANHATLRGALLQLTPWAIDHARAIAGLPPLPEA